MSDEILRLLKENVARQTDVVKQQVTKRCRVLASFMETLLDDVTINDLKLEMPQESELTASERDSVMLGEISPHHDYYDSKSSSETPPTYNELNYNENIHRFFNSHPTTIGINKAMKIVSGQVDNNDETPSNNPGPVEQQRFKDSGGCGSAGNMSSESNVLLESTTITSNTGTGTSSGSSQPALTLTEALISKHNNEMENFMLKRHIEARNVGRGGEKTKKGLDRGQERTKRGGSHSWEDEAHKIFKHRHLSDPNRMGAPEAGNLRNIQFNEPPSSKNVNVWPPLSVSLTSVQNSHMTTANQMSAPQSLYPAYYIPAPQPNHATPHDHRLPTASPYAMQYPHPQLYGQHIVYPHPPLMYQPLPFQSITPSINVPEPQSMNNTFTVRCTSRLL